MKHNFKKLVAFAMAMLMMVIAMIFMVGCSTGGKDDDPLAFMRVTEEEARERGGKYLVRDGKFYALDSFPYENAVKYGVGVSDGPRPWGEEASLMMPRLEHRSDFEYVAAGEVPDIVYTEGDKLVCWGLKHANFFVTDARFLRNGLPINMYSYLFDWLGVRVSVEDWFFVSTEQLKITSLDGNNEYDWPDEFGDDAMVNVSVLDESGALQRSFNLRTTKVYSCTDGGNLSGHYDPELGYVEFDLANYHSSPMVVIGTTLIKLPHNENYSVDTTP